MKAKIILILILVGVVLFALVGCTAQSAPVETNNNYYYDEKVDTVIRFYYDITEGNPAGLYTDFEYFEVTFYSDDWLEQALALMNENTLFDIGGIWYEGERLYADLIADSPYGNTWQALQGSTGAWINGNILLLNLASFPNVEEIVILMNGERDSGSDHFSFEGIFVVTDSDAAEIRERIRRTDSETVI